MRNLFACFFSLLSTMAFSQNLDSIIQRYYKAIGGNENWDKVKTMSIKCKGTMQTTEVKCMFYIEVAKAVKSEMTLAGMTIESVLTDTSGWMLNPLMGHRKAQKLSAEEISNLQESIHKPDELILHKKLNYAVKLKDSEKIQDTLHYVIELTRNDSSSVSYYINSQTYLLKKLVLLEKRSSRKIESVYTIVGYKKVGKIKLYSNFLIRSGDGITSYLEYTDIKVNPKFKKELFTRPKDLKD